MDFRKVVGILGYSTSVLLSATVLGCSAVPCSGTPGFTVCLFLQKVCSSTTQNFKIIVAVG